MSKDYLQRFMFDSRPVRGEIVRVSALWQEILNRRHYPESVAEQLGELVAAGALLSASMKIEGQLTLQLQARGALYLMVVQINQAGDIRAVARFHENQLSDLKGLLALCQEGELIITLESNHFKQPYQGVVSLESGSIAQVVMHYFAVSEQLPTWLLLNCQAGDLSGILLQTLPGHENEKSDFDHAVILAQTLTHTELHHLSVETLLQRLYHEDEIRLYDEQAMQFACTCSFIRTRQMLTHLDTAEIEEILAKDGFVQVSCEFCGKHYRFDEIDLKAAPTSETIH